MFFRILAFGLDSGAQVHTCEAPKSDENSWSPFCFPLSSNKVTCRGPLLVAPFQQVGAALFAGRLYWMATPNFIVHSKNGFSQDEEDEWKGNESDIADLAFCR